ncbi:MAG: hypothetical protein H8E66_17290 [Planctomycetes bacterium]|nr:hypothetical protein [Planctomycetota bacterium]
MNELKIHVERAVRPVYAAGRTKLRMRNELYAHILDIYEEELSQAKDERAALDATMSRFGPPHNLTTELQQTVSWLEQREGMLDKWLIRRSTENELQHAGRLATSYLLLCPSVVLLAAGVTWGMALLGHTEKGFIDIASDMFRYGLSVLVLFSIQIFAFTLIGTRIYRQMERSRWPKSPTNAVLLSIFSTFFVLASGWLLHLVMTGSPHESFTLLFPRWLAFATLMPFAVIGFAMAVRKETAVAAPWTGLPIED